MCAKIPRLDAALLAAEDPATLSALAEAAGGVGFATVHNTDLDAARVARVIEAYRRVFHLPEAAKRSADMARTGANRGWGAPGSEQVDPDANPDYKQYFDVGVSLPQDHNLAHLPVYAPNVWPDLPDFRAEIESYYSAACAVAMDVLRALAQALGHARGTFDAAFEPPMALLRGNYYPERPAWTGSRDFGIATHTDYGCLTLLATDGTPGLEVRVRGGGWLPVAPPVGEFVINFGEMMQIWTGGAVRATPHRVVGTRAERISVPLFFNPAFDANVAPEGAAPVRAGDHLARRFSETYVHLQDGAA
ncbi:MAG: 2-oxoglutarate and iron-dependent oxygenase domain-containing protein [Pseudomonadota bacterium]